MKWLPIRLIAFASVLASSQISAQGGARDELSIAGTVRDEAGRPVPYGYVYERASGQSVVANSEGQFRLTGIPSGVGLSIGVRRIGYRPFERAVTASEATGGLVNLRVEKIAAKLDTVRIRAAGGSYDDYLDRSGYYRRSVRGVDGTFITAAQIERRSPTELTAVLRDVSGVRVMSRGGKAGKNNVALGRGGICALGLIVDGRRVEIDVPPVEAFQPRITSIMGGRAVRAIEPNTSGSMATMDQAVPPSMLAAMEVYPSAASVPNELQHHVKGCGLVVVWTRYQ